MFAILGSFTAFGNLKFSPFWVVFNIFLVPFFNQLWGFQDWDSFAVQDWDSFAVDSLVSLGVFNS